MLLLLALATLTNYATSWPAAAPPMGYNTFDLLATSHPDYGLKWLNESNIKAISDALTLSGLQSYKYINIDSGWSSGFDDNGIPIPDPTRWPSGIDGLANFLHERTQLLGLYTTIGLAKEVYNKNVSILGTNCTTSQIAALPLTEVPNGWHQAWMINWSHPCAQPYIDSIVARFASWNIDLLKVDGTTTKNVPDVAAFQQAIHKSGRTIWFTLSAWPVPIQIADDVSSCRVLCPK